jgi:hypothetical protein
MTTKQKILRLVEQLPDDINIDQAIDRLYLLQKIETGLQQARRGEGKDHDEFMKELLAEDEKS